MHLGIIDKRTDLLHGGFLGLHSLKIELVVRTMFSITHRTIVLPCNSTHYRVFIHAVATYISHTFHGL